MTSPSYLTILAATFTSLQSFTDVGDYIFFINLIYRTIYCALYASNLLLAVVAVLIVVCFFVLIIAIEFFDE